MSLFYESIGRKTNNRLLLFVTLLLHLEHFRNTRQARLKAIRLAREALNAVSLRFIRHMKPAANAILGLCIFQN
jgi:hypothetical protein